MTGQEHQPLTGMHVLVVDDNQQPHVIVSDLSMPGVDGFEFIRRVRALPGQSERPTPAIAFSGLGDEQHRSRALSNGFQLYLTKPIVPEALTETILGLRRDLQ